MGSLTGLDPAGMTKAVATLRAEADRMDHAADLARTALAIADLQSPVLARLIGRSEQFRRIANELQNRVEIITDYTIDPGGVDPALVAAAVNAPLETFHTIADLNRRIDNWEGSDNDPLFDDLIRQRKILLAESYGNARSDAVDPLIAAVAEQNNLSYREAEFVVLSAEAESLTVKMAASSHPGQQAEWERLSALRADALEELLAGDADLARQVAQHLDSGEGLFDAVPLAVHDVYAESSIADLQEAMFRHGTEASFGLALTDLNDLHSLAIATFTGVDTSLVNPRIAAVAQQEGLAYNALVEQFNEAIESGEIDGKPIPQIEINATIPNDATLLWNLSQRDLFTELETSMQGDTSEYDGKLSIADLQTVASNPEEFSAAAVAVATALLADDELRLRLDTAGSGQFLDGVTSGTHAFDDSDGIISMADVEQHLVNSLVYGLLEPVADSMDSDHDGSITRAEFEAHLDSIDPTGGIAAAINYALSEGAFADRDDRSTTQKIGDGLWTLAGTANGSASFDDHMSFAKGLLWEFPKGLAVLAYDVTSLVPGQPTYFIEAHTNWGGDEHRGVALLTGLADAGQIGLSLVPGTPQYAAEMERVRRSGRFSDHAGFGLIATVADWETFVDDPAQWFGTITGDVLLTAATGGYGGIATRGGSLLRTGARMRDLRHLTNLDDLRSLRHMAGTKLDRAFTDAQQRLDFRDSYIFRGDDKPFSSEGRTPDRIKSHLDPFTGTLLPANRNGSATLQQHVRGAEPKKSDSPYTSFSGSEGDVVRFGDTTIRVNRRKLEADIASGRVQGVRVISPDEVLRRLEERLGEILNKTRSRLSQRNSDQLTRAQLDYENARNSAEYLIEGPIPSRYIRVLK